MNRNITIFLNFTSFSARARQRLVIHSDLHFFFYFLWDVIPTNKLSFILFSPSWWARHTTQHSKPKRKTSLEKIPSLSFHPNQKRFSSLDWKKQIKTNSSLSHKFLPFGECNWIVEIRPHSTNRKLKRRKETKKSCYPCSLNEETLLGDVQ